MNNDYFANYSFEVPSTDLGNRGTKYSFTGPKDYIDSIKQKPVEVACTENVNGWLVESKGYGNGVLKTKAEKMLGTRIIKIESIISNKLPKFKPIELNEYSPYNPIGDIISFVEVYDKQARTDPNFVTIDEQAEQSYERKYGNSSIISVSDFLKDKEFEKMLKSLKVEDNA